MNRFEAQARIDEVQRIMERTTLYTLLPGPPAILGGVLTGVGCAVSYVLLRSLDLQGFTALTTTRQIAFCVMWGLIATLAVGFETVWGAHAWRMRIANASKRSARLAAWSLCPALAVAAALTVRFMVSGEVRYIAPVWMMCYGTGVWSAGLFSVRLPRLLGAAFIVLGAAGLLFFEQYGIVLIAVSFGVLHLLFGVLVMAKSQRAGSA